MISVGIDIGEFSVKVAEVEATSRGYVLIQAKEFPLSTDPTKDTRIEIIEILRELIPQYDRQYTKFVIGIHQDQVTLRRRFFPFKERHKILKSLPFELEEDIPLSHEDAIFEAKITRFVGDQTEVLALACPKEVIEAALQLTHDGGFEADIISVDGLALSNIWEDIFTPPPEVPAMMSEEGEENEERKATHQVPGQGHVLLDIGHVKSRLLLFGEGRLLTARTIDWGGKDIAMNLAKKYNLHYVEALKEQKNKGFVLTNNADATKDQIFFSDTIKSSLDELAHGLNLTLMDVQSEFHIEVKGLSVIGGVSQLKNIGPYLTQKLEITCNRIQKSHFHPQLDFKNQPQNELVTSTAIGLALEGIKKPRRPAINLLKGEFARQSQTFKIFWEKWGYTVKVAAASFIVMLTYSILRENFALSMADQARSELRQQAQNLAGLKGLRANVSNTKRFIRRQRRLERTQEMAENVTGINSALDLLKKVSEVAPPQNQIQMEIQNFVVENEWVTVEGYAKNKKALNQFQSSLKNISKGSQLTPLNRKLKAPDGWNYFGFRIKLDREVGG